NFGYSESRGSIINWLDSDDILLPAHIEFHVNLHKEYSVDALISSASLFLKNTNIIVDNWDVVDNGNIIEEMIFNTLLWPINCVSWKRLSIPPSPFDESLMSSQEWTFHLKQLISNKAYKALEEKTCLIRRHDNRIGNLISAQKNYSSFMSRKIILNLL